VAFGNKTYKLNPHNMKDDKAAKENVLLSAMRCIMLSLRRQAAVSRLV
jgi:hypothetical protein